MLDDLDAASGGPYEKGKNRSGGLAKQARKLKNVFKRHETHETQRKENIPEHSQVSTESLPREWNEQLPRLYDNVQESFPTRLANHFAPTSIYSGNPDHELDNNSTRPEEPLQPDGIDPLLVSPLSEIYHDVSHLFSLPSSSQQQDLESNQPHTSPETKRRRRRESHNVVEKRRRHDINESLKQLSRLVPHRRFQDYNPKLSELGSIGGSIERGPKRGDILKETVSWTRDLMKALYGKIQQQYEAKEYIDSLGGTWPFESNEDERRLQNEVIDAFDADGNIFIPPRPWDREIHAERPERFESQGSAINAKEANAGEPALHTKVSHGSLISFSGSVHSFTSLTYRSASGKTKTKHTRTVSNFELSEENIEKVPEDKLRAEKWEAGFPRRHSMSPYFVPSTQTFVTSPTNEELISAPRPGLDRDGARKPDKQSSKLRPGSHTSLDSLVGSRQDDISPGNSQRLNEADLLATNQFADISDLSVQTQEQPPVSAEMDEEAGLRPFRLQENSLSNSHQDLVESDPRVTYLENKLVRLRWKCSCNRPFQMDVLEHEKGAALAAIQELDQSNCARDEPSGPLNRLFMFLVRVGFLLHIFSRKRETDETLPTTNPLPTKADDIIQTRLNPADPDPERYVCVCFPGMTYKKYLHHVDVNKTIDDQQLFAAMQKKYHEWKPFWRRIFTLRTLVRVEYFEFKIYYSNLVTIKDDWRDRFPQGHDPGEWSYNPTSRDMTPYLIDDVLTHYVHSPQCAKIGKYFWNRIPKKVFCKLECPNDKPFKVGWGLYFVEEFSQFYLMLVLVPVLAAGIALAIWYCIRFHRSFADGATVVSGFAGVVMYLFSVAQGWYKQRGAL